jgi:glutamyl-tRNA synthetase
MTEVRTRFAPSPTGKLHIGGVHTALYCWLFARRHGGKFILRIEDTDRDRSTEENVQVILDGLRWMGLDWDEGPFFQSERMDLYKSAVQKCLAGGFAYRCTCTPAELDAKRERAQAEKRKFLYDGTCREKNLGSDCGPHAVRFRMPREGKTTIEDRVKGTIEYPNEEMDDWIIARSDGTPVYNFCVVVDDADMGITHVIRGDDHVNNTPKQIHVYRALGHALPVFAHVPLIHGPDGSKLSKRHGAVSITEYREMGFLPDAVRNYLARLGWAHGDQEIFTDEELIRWFDLGDLSKSASIFDMEKFLWTNSVHMRQKKPAELAPLLIPFLKARGYEAMEGPWLNKLIENFLERKRTLAEIADSCSYFFVDDFQYEEKAARKFLRPESVKPLSDLRTLLAGTEPFEEAAIGRAFETVCGKHGLQLGAVAQPVRVAVTGGSASPGIFEVLALVGKERTLKRLDRALAFIRGHEERQVP